MVLLCRRLHRQVQDDAGVEFRVGRDRLHGRHALHGQRNQPIFCGLVQGSHESRADAAHRGPSTPTPTPSRQVWLGYCDGNSFSGMTSAPYNANGTLLYFNGRAIIDAALDYISTTVLPGAPGLFTAAERVLLTGCSAGGLATYLHADYVGAYVAARLPKGTLYGAASISGFFLQVRPLEDGGRGEHPLPQLVLLCVIVCGGCFV